MKNLLLVDDDMLLRLVVTTCISLNSQGWNVLAASSGKEAVQILSSQPVHFVLTDVRMPDMDGFQLIEYINAHHTGLPVAAMSGDGGINTRERLGALGVTKFLEKPFSLKNLQSTISDVQQTDQEKAAFHIIERCII